MSIPNSDLCPLPLPFLFGNYALFYMSVIRLLNFAKLLGMKIVAP